MGSNSHLRKKLESLEQFLYRISPEESRKPTRIIKTDSRENDHWLFRIEPPKSSSLQCNIWEGTALDLTNQDYLAIVPFSGWWKIYGSGHEEDKTRYALVISIFTDDPKIDIYSEISEIVNQHELKLTKSELSV